jgi:membrane protein implicated in regulation of membrane protease activity
MTLQGDGTDYNNGQQAGSLESEHHVMGVRVVFDPDPAIAAARLADELSGDLLFDVDSARSAFAARTAAGKTDPVVLDEEEYEALRAQVSMPGTVDIAVADDATIAELRELAESLGRTERIRVRTEVEFTDMINRRLSASSGVAVHPETIRQAAKAVVEAETEMTQIEESIGDLGERPLPEEVELDTMEAPAAPPKTEDREQRRRARGFALAIGTIFVGVGLILLSAGVPAVAPIIVFAVGAVLTVVLLARSFTGGSDDQGAREASALLVAATSNVQRTSEAGVSHRLAEEEWMARRSQLDASRERAEERVRSARRHWEGLAGADADPYDLDSVLRVHDPQFVITGAATKTSPTMRTVNAVHRKVLARWKVAWAALGYDLAPSLEEAEMHLGRLSGAEVNPEAEMARARLQAAERWAEAGATIDRPMILVEPENWLPEEELESMLGTLPAGAEVILVTR